MRVILARHRGARPGGRPPAVHAYRVPDDPFSVPVWRAACGHELEPAEAEEVPQFTGAPCSTCLMFAIADDHRGHRVEAGERSAFGTYPALQPVTPGGRHAVALWGERQSHLVAPDARRSRLDGRDVVMAMCGHLAWGPLASAPPGWPLCEECGELARPGS